MTVKVKVLCQFCGAMNEMAPEFKILESLAKNAGVKMYDLSKERPSIRRHLLHAGLPARTLGMEFSDLDPSFEVDQVKAWVSLVQSGEVIRAVGKPSCGVGLLLAGKPGHGKTTMASVAKIGRAHV